MLIALVFSLSTLLLLLMICLLLLCRGDECRLAPSVSRLWILFASGGLRRSIATNEPERSGLDQILLAP